MDKTKEKATSRNAVSCTCVFNINGMHAVLYNTVIVRPIILLVPFPNRSLRQCLR